MQTNGRQALTLLNFIDLIHWLAITEFSFCMMQKTGVKISDVRYSGASGTSKSTIAINLNCSQAVPCTNIVLDAIELASSTPGKQVNSSCNNAYGRAMGVVKPKSCLLQQF